MQITIGDAFITLTHFLVCQEVIPHRISILLQAVWLKDGTLFRLHKSTKTTLLESHSVYVFLGLSRSTF